MMAYDLMDDVLIKKKNKMEDATADQAEQQIINNDMHPISVD